MSETRKLDINLYDTNVGIWQDDANDPSFRGEIFEGLLRLMKRRGWKITADPQVLKHYRCISKNHRLAKRGDLRAEVEISGRHAQVHFWAETWPIDNINGRRYDFDKRKRLTFLDRLRVDLETKRIIAWLAERAVLKIKDRDDRRGPHRGGITAFEFVQRQYAASWHSDKELGRPVCKQSYNSRSGDGGEIKHGATVWFVGSKGRILRGTALYNINNMWWVITDRWGVRNEASHQIFVRLPDDIRRKRNERERRTRMEGELARAIRLMQFARAETLRKILFGEELSYGIWAKDKDAFYRSSYSGYTTDSISAGRYTWEEAAKEVRRVPSELFLVTPDGKHLSATDLGTARRAA